MMLLGRLRALGATLTADGEALAVDAPAGALTPALVAELKAHKWALLAALAAGEPEVARRAAAMRARHTPRPGSPLPFFTVGDVPCGAAGCLSCGAPLTEPAGGLGVRCRPCALAAHLVTMAHRPEREEGA